MRSISVAVLLIVFAIAGCGDSAPSPATPGASTGGATSGGSSAMGPGLSVPEALARSAQGPVLVRGYVVAHGDDVRLCEALAESFPPQCGGSSLTLVGLDLSARDDLEQEGDVQWSASELKLLGEIGPGTFTVNPAASG
ncbi:MAG: hypothetical protein O3B31_00760 [Chloroflexi bacterium]|nr:hypothetical protein [Chloroflexota bacterium]MDA1001871.1 hypothetical protein [Chloroflexota bacterium]